VHISSKKLCKERKTGGKVWYVEKMYYFCMVNTDKNGKM